MDVLDALFTRRSIRKFSGEVPDDEDIKAIVRAGFYAPSAHNNQPWHFVVIKEEKVLKEIAEMHPYAKMLTQAGCAVIVCGDSEKEKRQGFLVQDCSAAIENMLLAAHGLDLGAVWCGLFPMNTLTDGVKNILSLPDNILPVGMVVIGNSLEERNASERYDETKVHFNKW